jgi:hypothetical protein
MVGTRTVAAAVSVINGIWGIIAGAYWKMLFQSQSLGVNNILPPTNLVIIGIAVLLVLDSVVCLVGISKAFYASAVISLAMVGAEFAMGGGLDTTGAMVALPLMVVTVAMDIVGATRKQYVSEENHPLNLPVFG